MELGRRSFSSLVLGAALASSCRPPARARAPSFAPRLADERLFRRVLAAQHAVRRMGAVWPGFERTVVLAMLVYDAHGQWFLGTADDIPGFVPTGQTMHGLPVSYAEPSLFLAGRVTPFDTIRTNGRWIGRMGWRDFPASERRPSEPMILIREADTAIENANLRSIEEWVALYVHECFHVFQRRHSDVMRATRIDPYEDDDREALDVLTAKDSSFRQAIALELSITQA